MAGSSRISQQNIPKHLLDRRLTVFISDLHNARNEGPVFYCKGDKPFIQVLICGKITSVFEQKTNVCLLVNDGTGELICIIDNAVQKHLTVTTNIQKEVGDIIESQKPHMEDDLSWASVLLSYRVKKELDLVPDVRKSNFMKLMGQTVFVTGKLRRYEKLFLFVERISIAKEGSLSLDTHLTAVREINDQYVDK